MSNKLQVEQLREDYQQATLELEDAHANPIIQFERWFEEAVAAKVKEPNAMTLATANAEGRPSARIVLLKGFDANGFVFYTNYESKKGQELLQNPQAALVFSWLELEKQIRIEGKVEKLSETASTQYFQSRPKGSQIGAWVSPQSQIIESRNSLEEKVTALNKKYQDQDTLPKPDHWGGYLLQPDLIEFWQGRSSRLHDRVLYKLSADSQWYKQRLAP